MSMIALLSTVLLTEPTPPAPPSSDAEYQAAVEQEKAEQAAQREKVRKEKKKEAPIINQMNRGGGYIISAFGAEVPAGGTSFRYSFEGGGVMGNSGIPSATLGARFTHLPGLDILNFSVPLRLGVAGEVVGVYGLFEPGLTTFKQNDLDGEIETVARWRVAGGLSTFIVMWRGLSLGMDATWATLNEVITEEGAYENTEITTHIPSFSFVIFFGWKFGN